MELDLLIVKRESSTTQTVSKVNKEPQNIMFRPITLGPLLTDDSQLGFFIHVPNYGLFSQKTKTNKNIQFWNILQKDPSIFKFDLSFVWKWK